MLEKFINNKYFIITARIIVGLMFVVVGVGKIANASEFAKEIGNYQILPEALLNIVAIAIPWVELFVGVLFLFGFQQKASGLVIFGMLFFFTTAVIIAILKGLSIECGCYSQIASQKVGLTKVFENIILLILTAGVLFSRNTDFSLQNQ